MVIFFVCDLRGGCLRATVAVLIFPLLVSRTQLEQSGEQRKMPAKRGLRAQSRTPQNMKISCEQCYFRVNLLCALELSEPCTTFRPSEAQLRPPQQLRLVFRQERRTRAAWSFPSAQEQAALHA